MHFADQESEEVAKNLKLHDKGRTYRIIEKTLEELGYHTKSEVLNTMLYGGILQNRERLYIVRFRNKRHAKRFDFPKPIALETKVFDLLKDKVPEKYYYGPSSAIYKNP